MVYNYIGRSGGTSQLNSCIEYVVGRSMGEVELVFEETADRVLLANLMTRMIAGDKILISNLAQLAPTAVGVLDTLKAFAQKGIVVITVFEGGAIEAGLLTFISAVVSEISQGSHPPTMESVRERGQRTLLHG